MLICKIKHHKFCQRAVVSAAEISPACINKVIKVKKRCCPT
ncbi:unnamed protein product [Brugia timori]|uniref:Transcriptional regulator n=1 Tax=Brugia timori TaxID=42155 RepID=A0A0R3QGS5_9BILA|nr:unnamed protein product [Brugia timori]